MKCSVVNNFSKTCVLNRNIFKKKKAVVATTGAVLAPLASYPLLVINNNSNLKTEKESELLFESLLNETCDGISRFQQKEKSLLEELYKYKPELTLSMMSAKTTDIDGNEVYRFNAGDIDKSLSLMRYCHANFFKNNPNFANKIFSNDAIPKDIIIDFLGFVANHPEEYLKMEKSGLFELIKQGEIDSNILEKVNENIYLSESYLSSIKDKNDEKFLIKDLPNSFPNDDDVEIGQVYQKDDGLILPYNDKYYIRINLTPEKFNDLFQNTKDLGFQQGQVGDCWLISAIDGLMDTPIGKCLVYSMFEQDGEDILIKFPKSEQKIRFVQGELADVETGLNAPKGIKMLEQAFAIFKRNSDADDTNEIVVQNIEKFEEYLQEIHGGRSLKAIDDFFGASSENISLKATLKDLSHRIKCRIAKKEDHSRVDRYIENIKKYSNDKDKIVFVNFTDKTCEDDFEGLISYSYNLFSNHAYCIKKYNKETGTVLLTNPHDTRYTIEMPLAMVKEYIASCDVTSYSKHFL